MTPPQQPAAHDQAQGDVCIPNISMRERRKRLASGAVAIALALALLIVLLLIGASRWWRLALLPLFWAAASGYFQWKDET